MLHLKLDDKDSKATNPCLVPVYTNYKTEKYLQIGQNIQRRGNRLRLTLDFSKKI